MLVRYQLESPVVPIVYLLMIGPAHATCVVLDLVDCTDTKRQARDH